MEHMASVMRGLLGLERSERNAHALLPPSARAWDTGWRLPCDKSLQLGPLWQRVDALALGRGVLETVLQLQQQRGNQGMSGGGGLARLPVSVVRTICQQLSHADIEQCRLVCSDWRTSFGEASVTDMYLAMCADFQRASDLTLRFAKAYPNFHHLHFWIPGGPVRQMMGTDGSTFSQYMELFSACPVRVLTAHYLDDQICPIQGITRLSGLTKLELVDLMPANASLACLSALTSLRHLIVEYKDSSLSPDLMSVGQLHSLTHLELALHSTFVTNPVYMTLPGRGSSASSSTHAGASILPARPASEWLTLMLSTGIEAMGRIDGAEGHSRLEAILEAILDAVPAADVGGGGAYDEYAMGLATTSVSQVVAQLGALEVDEGDVDHAGPAHTSVDLGQVQGATEDAVGADESAPPLEQGQEPGEAVRQHADAGIDATTPAGASEEEEPEQATSALQVHASNLFGEEVEEESAGLEQLPTAELARGTSGAPLGGRHEEACGDAEAALEGGADCERVQAVGPSELGGHRAEAPGQALTDAFTEQLLTCEGLVAGAVTLEDEGLSCGLRAGLARQLLSHPVSDMDDTSASYEQSSTCDVADLKIDEVEEEGMQGIEGIEGMFDDECVGEGEEGEDVLAGSEPESPGPRLSVEALPALLVSGRSSVESSFHSASPFAACDLGNGPSARGSASGGQQASCGSCPGSIGEAGTSRPQRTIPQAAALPALVASPSCSGSVSNAFGLAAGSAGRSEGGFAQGLGVAQGSMGGEGSGLEERVGSSQSAAERQGSETEVDAPLVGEDAPGVLPNGNSEGASGGHGSTELDALLADAAAGVLGLPPLECVAPSPSGSGSAGDGASGSASATASPPPMRTLAVTAADYLVANMIAHWSRLRNLQRLELRAAPVGLARCYPLLFTVLPSLTELKLVGPDARLKAYGPSQPAFKVEVCRDSVSLALAPAVLALSLHCDTAGEASAALHQLALIASSVAPAPAAGAGRTGATPAAGASAPAPASVPAPAHATGSSVGAAGGSNRQAAWAPWSASPSFGEMLAAASAAPRAYPVGALPTASSSAAAAAAQAAEEKRRQVVMQQHPTLGILQAHAAKLATLRLYLENPDFASLKPLTHLSHMQELYIALCYTTSSDSESEEDPFLVEEEVSVADNEPTTQAQAALLQPSTTAQEAALSAATAGAGGAPVQAPTATGQAHGDQPSASRQAQVAGASTDLSPKHIMTVLRNLPCLTSLTLREEIPAGEESSLCSHDQCALSPASCAVLVHSLKHLVHLEWQGMLVAPHPSSLQALSSLACLRSLTLVVNQDDPMARLGLHCLPPSLTSLTLQNISVAPAPRAQPHRLPTLCHLHLKSCALPDVCTFAAAPSLEWLSLDNCDVSVYVPDLVDLWPSLSWLEITYTHQDWRLLHAPSDLAALGNLTRLRKLSLVTPYEDALTTDALLALTQLRLLSISPSPGVELMRLAELRFLAGLEIRLYSDVLHHEVDMAGALHADLQECLPMTDVLIMVDDSYADDPS